MVWPFDHTNVLALPADYITTEKAQQLVDAFLEAQPKEGLRFSRRLLKMDSV